ncbi:MAG: hypothetical protein LAQ69_45425 [Acidobacteriia bacterium]|nr:hypothetical protein [Terriglobia bacterium]
MHERDPINFDFRVVALLTIMVTRPDLLQEYLAGAPLEPDNPSKWVTLRGLGLSAELLSEMLFLFQRHDVQQALRTMQRLFRTMEAIESYCEDQCPDDDWLAPYVASTGRIPQQLSPAGVQVEA